MFQCLRSERSSSALWFDAGRPRISLGPITAIARPSTSIVAAIRTPKWTCGRTASDNSAVTFNVPSLTPCRPAARLVASRSREVGTTGGPRLTATGSGLRRRRWQRRQPAQQRTQPASDQPEDRLAKLGGGHDRAGDGEGVADHGVPERTLVLLLRRLAHLRSTPARTGGAPLFASLPSGAVDDDRRGDDAPSYSGCTRRDDWGGRQRILLCRVGAALPKVPRGRDRTREWNVPPVLARDCPRGFAGGHRLDDLRNLGASGSDAVLDGRRPSPDGGGGRRLDRWPTYAVGRSTPHVRMAAMGSRI